jgi:ABC-2 type transport system permease protein
VTLWGLEVVRLFRSKRWLILAAVYGFFGLLGPLTARYLPDILERVDPEGPALPEFGPADGILQYVGNAQQLGILAVAFIAASALALDSNTELSVFFRTRASIPKLLTPRVVINAIAASVAFTFGALIAYVGTGVLLGWVDFVPFLIGVLLHCVYLAFAVVVVCLMASIVRKVVTTALLTLGALILFAVLTLIRPIARWLPSDLAGALDALIRGGDFVYWRSLAATVVLSAVILVVAMRRFEHREV